MAKELSVYLKLGPTLIPLPADDNGNQEVASFKTKPVNPEKRFGVDGPKKLPARQVAVVRSSRTGERELIYSSVQRGVVHKETFLLTDLGQSGRTFNVGTFFRPRRVIVR